jgi:hypothetical protein
MKMSPEQHTALLIAAKYLSLSVMDERVSLDGVHELAQQGLIELRGYDRNYIMPIFVLTTKGYQTAYELGYLGEWDLLDTREESQKLSITLWVASDRYVNDIVGVFTSVEKAVEGIEGYTGKKAEKISDDDDDILIYQSGHGDYTVQEYSLDEIPTYAIG